MLNKIKRILPPTFKKTARKCIKAVKYNYRRQIIRIPVLRSGPIKIILGAAETHQDGWYSSNENWLDITNAEHWKNVLHNKQLITHAVAEHVFEHLTPEECRASLEHIFKALQPGGRLRIAVPDGYNPDPEYIRHVGINGIGDDAADHKQLLNVDTLSQLMQDAGFKIKPIEYFDKNGQLHTSDFDITDGNIQRSRKHATDKIRATWSFPDAATSLIIDGIKAS